MIVSILVAIILVAPADLHQGSNTLRSSNVAADAVARSVDEGRQVLGFRATPTVFSTSTKVEMGRDLAARGMHGVDLFRRYLVVDVRLTWTRGWKRTDTYAYDQDTHLLRFQFTRISHGALPLVCPQSPTGP